jgi:spermidine synthase
MDFKSFALLLLLQFLVLATTLSVWRFVSVGYKSPQVLCGALFFKGLVLLISCVQPGHWLWLASVFYVAAAVEYSLLFYLTSRAGVHPRAQIIKLNFLLTVASAFGLLLVEKLFFRFFPNHFILIGLIALNGLNILLVIIILRQTAAPFPSAKARSIYKAGQRLRLPLLAASGSGIILFGGVLIAYRRLRMYLRDAADINAEVTAISLLISATVTMAIARRVTKNIPEKRSSILLFSILAMIAMVLSTPFLGDLVKVPREFFIFIILFGVSGTASYWFNVALLETNGDAEQMERVLKYNAWGAVVGTGVFGIFALPGLGMVRSFQLYILLSCILLFLLFWMKFWNKPDRRRHWGIILSTFGLLSAVGFAMLNTLWYARSLEQFVARQAPGEKLVRTIETPQDVWILTERTWIGVPMYFRILQNAHSMSSTGYLNQRYMKLMAYVAGLYSYPMQTALNIGYGTGLTAQALLEYDALQRLDVIDVSKDIQKFGELIYAESSTPNPLNDQRLAYHTGGARYFLHQTKQKYDVITGEPPPPANSLVSYLYTKEFYELVKAHLTESGVFTYWLPVHSLAFSSSLDILKTFCAVFPNCDIYAGTDTNLILVGTLGSVPDSRVSQQKIQSLAKTRVAESTGLQNAQQVISLLLGNGSQLQEKLSSARILQDSHSYIQEGYPGDLQGYRRFYQEFLQTASPDYGGALAKTVPGSELTAKDMDRQFTLTAENYLHFYESLRALCRLHLRPDMENLIPWFFGMNSDMQRKILKNPLSAGRSAYSTALLVRFLQERKLDKAIEFMDTHGTKEFTPEKWIAISIALRKMKKASPEKIRGLLADYQLQGGIMPAGLKAFADE